MHGQYERRFLGLITIKRRRITDIIATKTDEDNAYLINAQQRCFQLSYLAYEDISDHVKLAQHIDRWLERHSSNPLVLNSANVILSAIFKIFFAGVFLAPLRYIFYLALPVIEDIASKRQQGWITIAQYHADIEHNPRTRLDTHSNPDGNVIFSGNLLSLPEDFPADVILPASLNISMITKKSDGSWSIFDKVAFHSTEEAR